jgi:hypothetical protein
MPDLPTGAQRGDLSRRVDLWLADGQAAGWGPRTLASWCDMPSKFSWWLSQEAILKGWS